MIDFFIGPAVSLGLKDCINPFALTSLLVLLFIFSVWADTAKRILFFGIIFILVSAVVKVLVNIGSFDIYLERRIISDVFRYIYLSLGAVFLLFGFFPLVKKIT